jgi:uncharacterized protein YbcI
MENAIRNAIIKFEQEFMGRGPDEVRAFIVKDLVVARLKGVLTPAERQLAKTVEGIDMVKRLRQNLIALGRDKLCEQVSEITGAKTLALFTDIDVQIGERVFVLTLLRPAARDVLCQVEPHPIFRASSSRQLQSRSSSTHRSRA